MEIASYPFLLAFCSSSEILGISCKNAVDSAYFPFVSKAEKLSESPEVFLGGIRFEIANATKPVIYTMG
jgi:hypothetical protein